MEGRDVLDGDERTTGTILIVDVYVFPVRLQNSFTITLQYRRSTLFHERSTLSDPDNFELHDPKFTPPSHM